MINKMSIYHYHLTIEDCTASELVLLAKSVKAKATTIDLYKKTKRQKDRMITKYSNDYEKIQKIINDDVKCIMSEGFKVIRIKVEEETDELVFNKDALYSEAHIKVKDRDLLDIEGFKLSNNSVDGTKFYNVRLFSGDNLDFIKNVIDSIPNVLVKKYEVVHIDTNQLHDLWW